MNSIPSPKSAHVLLVLLFLALTGQAQNLTNPPVQAPASLAHPRPVMRFTEPDPLDFSNHDGYVALFDGVSLKGWDGNPKFWRVEDGAIVGESTRKNPSGNTYLVYRGMKAKDFTLK